MSNTTSVTVDAAAALTEAYWKCDDSVPLIDSTVGELLRLRAAEHPDREALIGVRHDSGAVDRLTYAQLLDEASRVAHTLSDLAAPGSFVALWAPNVIEWTVIQYGAALAGMVLVALNPVLRDDDLDYALRHCRPALLLHAEMSRDYPMGQVAERVCATMPDLRCISLSQTGAWKAAEPNAEVLSHASADPDRPAMLQYTSGTTGRPKGVLLTHRAMVNVAKLTMEAVETPFGAKCFNPLPLFHTAGCVIATLGPLWVAGTSLLCERFVPATALATMRAEGVGVLFYVPTLLSALLHHQREDAQPAPQLTLIMGGASEVSSTLIDGAAAVFGAQVFNLYGQTELAPVLTLTRPGDIRNDRLATVGRPLPQVDCKIIDAETGHVLPVGHVGEICARGYQQFIAYLHDPAATKNALDGDGFVRTGDLGAMDHRGYITVTGRLKELIIRGGENIAPAEVEQVLVEHDSVSESIAIGLPDERFGEIVAAVCRVRCSPHDALKDKLIAYARERLPAYKVPARWFVVEHFPVTPTGKVQRFALRDAILCGEVHEL
jgi:fatty-acyl-CoA synthase/long-chain acyl-CoA synthetase